MPNKKKLNFGTLGLKRYEKIQQQKKQVAKVNKTKPEVGEEVALIPPAERKRKGIKLQKKEDVSYFLEGLVSEEKQNMLATTKGRGQKTGDKIRVADGLYLGRKHKLGEEWKGQFLMHLSLCGSVRLAAEHAGIARQTVYNAQNEETPEGEQFRLDVKLCREDYLNRLEEEADRRGMKGYEQDVWFRGEKVGVEKRFSDYLLALRLKAEGGEKYREGGTQINLNQNNQKTVVLGFMKDGKEIFDVDG